MADDHCEVLCLNLSEAEALRKQRLSVAVAEQVAARARALADPTRLSIAAALAEADELCVCDLAWITERPQNLVSHHLRTLKEHGFAESRREGKMVMYSMTPEGRHLLATAIGQGITG